MANTKHTTFRLPEDTKSALKAYAENRGLTATEAVIHLIESAKRKEVEENRYKIVEGSKVYAGNGNAVHIADGKGGTLCGAVKFMDGLVTSAWYEDVVTCKKCLKKSNQK